MQSNHKTFPVFHTNNRGRLYQLVKFDLLNEEHAEKYHGKSLATLAELGGLTWAELYWNYYNLPPNTHQNESQMIRMMEALTC